MPVILRKIELRCIEKNVCIPRFGEMEAGDILEELIAQAASESQYQHKNPYKKQA